MEATKLNSKINIHSNVQSIKYSPALRLSSININKKIGSNILNSRIIFDKLIKRFFDDFIAVIANIIKENLLAKAQKTKKSPILKAYESYD